MRGQSKRRNERKFLKSAFHKTNKDKKSSKSLKMFHVEHQNIHKTSLLDKEEEIRI